MKESKSITRDKILEYVNRLDFFSEFTKPEKEQIINLKTNVCMYDKQEHLINAGDKGYCMFIILKGKVKVTETLDAKPFAELSEGDIFGEIAFLTDKPRTATVIAKETTLVIKLEKKYFNHLSVYIR